MDQYIGKMLNNRYEILERIGTGGMAVVYKAKCHYLNRLVAIKILKSDLAQDEDFRRRFNAESQAVAQLSHPNIVSVYDVSKGGDTEYIVMELIDGITLKQYMERRGQLNWREALHFITQILRALSHAHSRGIVHRDIKPQNIMVLRDGSVKVADFGIACLENSSQTLTQEALGSVHYISPEQARGDRIDARSDIYSAGVVLYEMLTNRLPFEGDSAVSVAIQHLSSIPLAPREINSEVPEPLELICMKAMAPDLDRRYDSAEAMIADLESFRKNPGVSLDFSMDDLRPEEVDEPTRLLRTAHVPQNTQGSRHPHRERENRYDEESEKASPRKSGKRTLAIAGIVVIAAAVLFVLIRAIIGSFGTQEYTVPPVVGYTVEQAGELDGVKDVFRIVEDGTAPSDKYGAGIIISQDPTEGTVKKTDLVIKVIVSSGEDNGKMINVVGEEARNAEKVLLKDLKEQYDLKIETEEETSDKVTEGYIIATDPVEGETLKKGDTITLTVSSGPEKVTVPEFRQRPIDAAKSDAESTFGLVVEVRTQESNEDEGTVIDQSIAVGTQVAKGTKIVLTASGGAAARTKTVTIDLPTDRDTVQLVVELDGGEVYNKTVNCSIGSVQIKLSSTSATGQVSYYWDGVLQRQYTEDFTAE